MADASSRRRHGDSVGGVGALIARLGLEELDVQVRPCGGVSASYSRCVSQCRVRQYELLVTEASERFLAVGTADDSAALRDGVRAAALVAAQILRAAARDVNAVLTAMHHARGGVGGSGGFAPSAAAAAGEARGDGLAGEQRRLERTSVRLRQVC